VKRALTPLAALLLLALVAVPFAGGGAPARPTVAVFYYPWYGTPLHDGQYEMWLQNAHRPPQDIYSPFFPLRGVYSSSDGKVQAAQLKEIAQAGIDELVVSWWGWGSATDQRLPTILPPARKLGLKVAVHIEPYPGRTAESVASDVRHLADLGVTDVYVYNSDDIPAAEWAAVRDAMRQTLPNVRLFAQTPYVGFASAGHFDGIYTYDIVGYGPSTFARLCNQAHARGLLCAPSVGPGYDAVKADGDPRIKQRRKGKTYDGMWRSALAAKSDLVTITSYNEWGEGTQIEPARPMPGYQSYDGAWGLHGNAAAYAYIARTAYWAARLHKRR
jgi:glycoprotein endo-alpha-1,2-mannosidase